MSANNNTIHEKDSPAQTKTRNRLNNTFCSATTKRPQSKFPRNNSNPFPETVSRATPVQEDTPKKIDDSRQQKSFGKLLKYITPKKKKNKSMHDRSFKVYDELNIPSNASPPHQVSQVYEKSVNRHGDVVEYAVPYGDVQSPIINDSTGCGSVTSDVFDESWDDFFMDIKAVGPSNPVKITDLDKSSCGYRSIIQMGKTNGFTKFNQIDITKLLFVF